MTAEFSDWCRAVIAAMEAEPRAGGRSGGPFVDARIAFARGWSPTRAARALLGLDADDAKVLRESALGVGQDEEGKE